MARASRRKRIMLLLTRLGKEKAQIKVSTEVYENAMTFFEHERETFHPLRQKRHTNLPIRQKIGGQIAERSDCVA
jgi:hypothetical protein